MFGNEKIKTITNFLIKKYKNDFLEYPAASSMHHAYVSGLAHHTTSMLKVAKSLSKASKKTSLMNRWG